MIEYPRCHYCGQAVLEKHSRGDHWPVPKRYGGTATVPCCQPCHKAKDTLSLTNWDKEWLNIIFRDWPTLSREMKLFIAKLYDFCLDLYADEHNESILRAFSAGKRIRSAEWPEGWAIFRHQVDGVEQIGFDAPVVAHDVLKDVDLSGMIVRAIFHERMEIDR